MSKQRKKQNFILTGCLVGAFCVLLFGILIGAKVKDNVSNENVAKNESTKSEFTKSESEKNEPIIDVSNEEDASKTNASESENFNDANEAVFEMPQYDGVDVVTLNANVPNFTSDEKVRTDAFETYSELDNLGRCGVAFANICVELMPTTPRGEIGAIKPSGWHTIKYNDLIDGNYLYNRCHLIGYQLAGENANEKNLITGTRYLNVQGMLPYENEVADAVKEKNIHILYRVTPRFENDNLVATGVEMEAYSVEDSGKSVSFHVFVFNIQPGIVINYANGDSDRDTNYVVETNDDVATTTYVINTNTGKFHYASCSSVSTMADHNKLESSKSRDEIINMGFQPCKRCNP